MRSPSQAALTVSFDATVTMAVTVVEVVLAATSAVVVVVVVAVIVVVVDVVVSAVVPVAIRVHVLWPPVTETSLASRGHCAPVRGSLRPRALCLVLCPAPPRVPCLCPVPAKGLFEWVPLKT